LRSRCAKSLIDANTGAMRRLALAATIPLLCTRPLAAQSQVRQLPRSTPETATSDAPLPSEGDPTHPSTPNPAGPIRVSPREPERAVLLRPAAPDRDQLTNHMRLGAALAYGTFSGSFRDSTSIGSNLGGSTFFLADLGYGFSRHFELVVAGDYSHTYSGAGCDTCNAKSWAIGPMLRYHVVEGLRFSPWVSIGLSYRHNRPEYPPRATSVDSIEFLRIVLGGDWYMTSNLTLGPVLGVGFASSYGAPKGDSSEVFALVYGGLRVAFDLPGR
jgi:hypothetical protein